MFYKHAFLVDTGFVHKMYFVQKILYDMLVVALDDVLAIFCRCRLVTIILLHHTVTFELNNIIQQKLFG